MNFEKSDAILKKLKILLLSLLLLALLVCGILFRNSLLPGWHGEGEEKYYVKFPFVRATGITSVGGKDYFFSEIGEHFLLYGWNKADGFYYYSNPDGTIAKGDCTVDGEAYHFDPSTGALYKNVSYILDGKLWYFDDHGFKVFGIVELDGFFYCFSETGNLKRGLQVIDGKTYYFDPEDECMRFGLLTVSGDTYYFGEDGAAVTGEITLDGITYTFGPDGKQIS